MSVGGADPAGGAKDVDTYLARVPEDVGEALEKLRKTIRAAVPKATESISYGIPTFKLDGQAVIWFAAWKKHCSIYPLSAGVLQALGEELKPFINSRDSTIRFRADTPLPAALVREIVKVRIAENEALAER